ncbi:tyrosine-type recombinase/integrase [Pseudonocardia parietis]|uniref:tyrosine-type recombinase/integrase n=1 Tax=Pseudonocardia parietis TaxID=570936 RepID=UPI001AE5CAC4|nr:tyrosine-type recombinase/integrase [Pseudonocardia parietis]
MSPRTAPPSSSSGRSPGPTQKQPRRVPTWIKDHRRDEYREGTDAAQRLVNVCRSFRRIAAAAGLDAAEWTARELRHSFESLLSDSGVPLEHISRLVGHSGTAVTEAVYRQQLRPVLEHGAIAMDEIFRPMRTWPDV